MFFSKKTRVMYLPVLRLISHIMNNCSKLQFARECRVRELTLILIPVLLMEKCSPWFTILNGPDWIADEAHPSLWHCGVRLCSSRIISGWPCYLKSPLNSLSWISRWIYPIGCDIIFITGIACCLSQFLSLFLYSTKAEKNFFLSHPREFSLFLTWT